MGIDGEREDAFEPHGSVMSDCYDYYIIVLFSLCSGVQTPSMLHASPAFQAGRIIDPWNVLYQHDAYDDSGLYFSGSVPWCWWFTRLNMGKAANFNCEKTEFRCAAP